MADAKTIGGVVGMLGLIATALIVPEQIDQAEAQKRVDEATKIEATAQRVEIDVDSVTEKGDTVKIKRQVYRPAEHKYNPLIYLSGDSIEVTVRNVSKDTMLYISRFVADPDTTALLDVNVRLQPSSPPSEPPKTEPVEEPIGE